MSNSEIENKALEIIKAFGRYDEKAECYFMACGGYVDGQNKFDCTRKMMKAVVDKLKQESI